MDKVSKISKSKQVANDFKQQYKEENKDRLNCPSDFNTMLNEEKSHLKEKNKKDKEKSKQKANVRDIYKVELQKAITSKVKIIKQLNETEEDIEHDEK